jgi:sulfur-oxidizing protein SoxY
MTGHIMTGRTMTGRTMIDGIRIACRTAVLTAVISVAGIAVVFAQTSATDDPWPGIASDAFPGRTFEDGSSLLTLELPYRAEDAAIVPLTVRTTLPAHDPRRVKAITVVIDENPAPVAGTFRLGANSGITSISTRIRVNSYTNVHAVAELDDGKLYMVKTYVKASGGCSAPAMKNADAAKANIGQMRLRQFAPPAEASTGRAREAQIMLRHPNNSGLQMDQVTRLYVPAYFVRELKIWQGDELLMSVDASISISEDPNIRFDYRPNGATALRVEAVDTEDRVFRGEWPVSVSNM